MHTYDAIIEKARAQAQSGASLEAMQTFAEAAKLAPERKEAYVELGLIFYDKGDVEGAVEFYKKALEIDSDDAFVLLSLGLACFELEQWQEAILHLKKAVLTIQHFVAGVRVDALFVQGDEMDRLLARAAELEETGIQAIDVLRDIARRQSTHDEGEVRPAADDPLSKAS